VSGEIIAKAVSPLLAITPLNLDALQVRLIANEMQPLQVVAELVAIVATQRIEPNKEIGESHTGAKEDIVVSLIISIFVRAHCPQRAHPVKKVLHHDTIMSNASVGLYLVGGERLERAFLDGSHRTEVSCKTLVALVSEDTPRGRVFALHRTVVLKILLAIMLEEMLDVELVIFAKNLDVRFVAG
jgi:hypothetical protein